MAHRFSFDDTLYGVAMKAPALRRWLQAGLVGNTAKGKAREGWALEFTPHDLAILALVKPMTEFGVPVATAYAFAVRLMREQGPWSGDEPPKAHWTVWPQDTQVQISRALGRGGKPAWGMALFEQTEAYVCGAHLTLHPHQLIRQAIERAIEAAEIRTARRSA